MISYKNVFICFLIYSLIFFQSSCKHRTPNSVRSNRKATEGTSKTTSKLAFLPSGDAFLKAGLRSSFEAGEAAATEASLKEIFDAAAPNKPMAYMCWRGSKRNGVGKYPSVCKDPSHRKLLYRCYERWNKSYKAGCPADQVKSPVGLCHNQCPAGYTAGRQKLLCWEDKPVDDWVSCGGGAFAVNKKICGLMVALQTVSTLGFVFSWVGIGKAASALPAALAGIFSQSLMATARAASAALIGNSLSMAMRNGMMWYMKMYGIPVGIGEAVSRTLVSPENAKAPFDARYLDPTGIGGMVASFDLPTCSEIAALYRDRDRNQILENTHNSEVRGRVKIGNMSFRPPIPDPRTRVEYLEKNNNSLGLNLMLDSKKPCLVASNSNSSTLFMTGLTQNRNLLALTTKSSRCVDDLYKILAQNYLETREQSYHSLKNPVLNKDGTKNTQPMRLHDLAQQLLILDVVTGAPMLANGKSIDSICLGVQRKSCHYVMDTFGNIFLTKPMVDIDYGEFLTNGAELAAAGNMIFEEKDGTLQLEHLDNKMYYQPEGKTSPAQATINVMDALSSMTNTNLEFNYYLARVGIKGHPEKFVLEPGVFHLGGTNNTLIVKMQIPTDGVGKEFWPTYNEYGDVIIKSKPEKAQSQYKEVWDSMVNVSDEAGNVLDSLQREKLDLYQKSAEKASSNGRVVWEKWSTKFRNNVIDVMKPDVNRVIEGTKDYKTKLKNYYKALSRNISYPDKLKDRKEHDLSYLGTDVEQRTDNDGIMPDLSSKLDELDFVPSEFHQPFIPGEEGGIDYGVIRYRKRPSRP